EVSGHSRVTITLAQPCVVRLPKWTLIDSEDGSEVTPASSVVVSNTTFYMDFAGLIPKSACFVNPPYQDMEVQNFQGGFVRPGGQWFSVK
ncbi:MAG: hypothetical protein K2Q09_07235, partial [Phycisphaerales bacterium]|nr:hypothetical protein [Phycisphaerales bacterium]